VKGFLFSIGVAKQDLLTNFDFCPEPSGCILRTAGYCILSC
jgi:hypothetical protein